MTRLLFAALAAAATLDAVASGYEIPAWGATQSSPVATAPTDLQPGEWIWDGDASPAGPIAGAFFFQKHFWKTLILL